jgi:mycofactocin precursor
MADSLTAEPTDETVVTPQRRPGRRCPADDVLVEEVSIDGMCGVTGRGSSTWTRAAGAQVRGRPEAFGALLTTSVPGSCRS